METNFLIVINYCKYRKRGNEDESCDVGWDISERAHGQIDDRQIDRDIDRQNVSVGECVYNHVSKTV